MFRAMKSLALLAALVLIPTIAIADEDLVDADGNSYQVLVGEDGSIEVRTPDYVGPATKRTGAGGSESWWYTDSDGHSHAIIKSADGSFSHWDAPSPENGGCGCRTPLIPAP